MKLNLGPFSDAEIAAGFTPEIALETHLHFAPEESSLLGTFRADGAPGLMVAGTLDPDATGELLPITGTPYSATFPGGLGFSNTGAGSAAARYLYQAFFITPEAGTLEELAPKAGYNAGINSSTASNISVRSDPAASATIYWLFYNDGDPKWVQSGDSGMTDRGSTVIASGSYIFLGGFDTPAFVGGDLATWAADPAAEWCWIFRNASPSETWVFDGPTPVGTYLSSDPAAGDAEVTRYGGGEYVVAGGIQIPTGGRDVVAVVASANGAIGTGEIALTMAVTLDDDTEDTATATFSVPAWSANQADVFGYGTARDLLPDDPANADKKIKSVDGLVYAANMIGGVKLALYSTPDEDSFHSIGDTTRKELPFDTPGTVAIASGLDPQAYTKIGRPDQSELSVSFKYIGMTEQLARFNGVIGTLRADVLKNDTVIWERALYTGFRPRVSVSRGDGNDEVEGTAAGMYRAVMVGYGE